MLRPRHATLCLLALCALPGWGQQTVQVPEGRHGYDAALGLLVVAMSGEEVQQQWSEVKVAVHAGETFTFLEPMAVIATGTRYEATTTEGQEVAVYFTDLPLVHITTPHTIVDEPKVPATFRMWNGQVLMDGLQLGIEIRGGSSQGHPKKSYLIEFWADPTGDVKVDVPLLQMRSDDDWILQAMYIEPLRLRNVIGQELWMDMHAPHYLDQEPEARSGVRHAFTELFLNGGYQGLYAVGERVDRKQLQVLPYDQGIRGEIYKGIAWGGSTFTSIPPPFAAQDVEWGGFEHIHPEGYPGWPALSAFVELVVEGSDADFYAQVDQRFHRANAIDYYIFLNVLRAADNTGKNIFLCRYMENAPYFYVPWDLDGSFGLGWDGALNPDILWFFSNGLYDRWLHDLAWDGFRGDLCQRWDELRAGPITAEAIGQRFEDAHARLAGCGVYHREEMAWPDYQYQPGHLFYTTNWIAERIGYMDVEMAAMCADVGVTDHARQAMKVYPNPAAGAVYVEVPQATGHVPLRITNALGQLVREQVINGPSAAIDLHGIAAGSYQLSIHMAHQPPMHRTLIVQ